MKSKVLKINNVNNMTVTWEEAMEGFLFFKKANGLSQRTLSDYKEHIQYFFRRYPNSWQSPKLKISVIEYMSDDIKPATYNIRLIYLRGFFEWCCQEDYLDLNPMKAFKKRKAEPRIVSISEESLKKLLELPDLSTFAGLRDYALIFFTLDTGIRPKEAFSLKIQDFDLKHLSVTIPTSIAKTRTSRSLPLLPPTAEAIHKLLLVRHPSWTKTIPVFCSSEGTSLNRHTWNDRMEFYSEKLGIKIRPYDLRHSFALMYLRNGGHAFGLQKTLGHTDMNMTKSYVNLTGQDLREVHQLASPLNRIAPTKRKRIRKIGK
jgi:site-specific recombinase XerD